MRHATLYVCVCVLLRPKGKKTCVNGSVCVCMVFFFACSKRMQVHRQFAFTWAEAKKSDRERKFEERRPGLEKQKSSKNGIHPRTCRKACQRASLFLFHWLPELKKHTPKEKENLTCRKARQQPSCVCACVRSIGDFSPGCEDKTNFRKKTGSHTSTDSRTGVSQGLPWDKMHLRMRLGP